jgi:hypothetical protein
MTATQDIGRENRATGNLTINCESGNCYRFDLTTPQFPLVWWDRTWAPLDPGVAPGDEDEVRFGLAVGHFTLVAEEVLASARAACPASMSALPQPMDLSLSEFADDLAFHMEYWGLHVSHFVECKENINALGYLTVADIDHLRARLDQRCNEYRDRHQVRAVPMNRDVLPEQDLWEVNLYEEYDQMMKPISKALADRIADYCLLRHFGNKGVPSITDAITRAWKANQAQGLFRHHSRNVH